MSAIYFSWPRELTDGAGNSQHENEHGTDDMVRTGEIKTGPARSKNDALTQWQNDPAWSSTE
jgi:hypothetical protein